MVLGKGPRGFISIMSDYRDTDLFDFVEGNYRDTTEPPNKKRTTTLNRVSVEDEQPVGSTGNLETVRMNAENPQDNASRREAPAISADETAPAPPSAEARAKLMEAASQDESKPTILIVEDTAELAEVIEVTLKSSGMAVASVSHGAKALEIIKQYNPDVVLLDIGLPDMTGWKMLEELRAWKSEKTDNPEMPTVIVITAYGDPANRLIGKLQGVHSYLIKPFVPAEVEKVVRSALDANS
jgi:CheY-like chemotaxis protein